MPGLSRAVATWALVASQVPQGVAQEALWSPEPVFSLAGGDSGQDGAPRPDEPAPGERIVFPQDELFRRPVADVDEPRTFASYQQWNTDEEGSVSVVSVGLGRSFPLLRFPGGEHEASWQIGLMGAAFPFFHLDGADNDLVSTDFQVGGEVSVRDGAFSARGRFFHQSSHVESPFLLRKVPSIPVTKLSYEVVEILGAWERAGCRGYGGVARILSSSTSLDRNKWVIGADVRRPIQTALDLVAGVHLEVREQTDWHGDVSVRVGVDLKGDGEPPRAIGLFVEYYRGHVPWGQLHRFKVEYYGLGLSATF